MTTPYNIDANIFGRNGFGLPFCDTIFTVTLLAATEATITVPGSGYAKYIAVFSYEANGNVWVAANNTAAVPVGGTFAASKSELNPIAKYVKAGDVIHAIASTAATDMSVAFYTIQD